MERLTDILHREQCSCVIRHGGTTREFHLRGVADLYRLLNDEPEFLHSATVADKVVGKAAAALMILGGVENLYADTISTLALELLSTSDIRVSFGQEVPHIVNRAKDGWCPLETLCRDCHTATECLAQIETFIKSQTSIKQ